MIGHLNNIATGNTRQVTSSRSNSAKMMSGQQNIVRIPAKTAMPIISSVPKCREPSSKSSQTYLLDTKLNSSSHPERIRTVMQATSGSWRDHELQSENSSVQRRNVIEDDRVLIIVNDDHINGGGIPIIGRRLPMKSMMEESREVYHNHQQRGKRRSKQHVQSVEYLQPPTIQIDQMIPAMQTPVVGRRSHRMQQLVGLIPNDYEQILREGERSELARRSSQPLSIVEAQLVKNQQVRHVSSHESPKYLVETRMIDSKANSRRQARETSHSSAHLQRDIVDHPQALRLQYSHRIGHSENRKQAINSKHSSQTNQLNSSNLTQSSCSSIISTSQNPTNINYSYEPDSYPTNRLLEMPACDEPCCRFEQDTYNNSNSTKMSSNRQKKPLPCCSSPRGYLSGHVTTKDYQEEVQYQDQRRQTRPLSSGHHNSHRANSAYRSSSCHDNYRAHRGNHPSKRLPENVPPIPSKPQMNYSTRTMNSCQEVLTNDYSSFGINSNSLEQTLDENTTQMYESLAAELKAKLGNPKHAPILLPPKDYDTMSRRQGKLIGIEQRRSTNPQLVGPTANRQSMTASATITEESNPNYADSSSKLSDQIDGGSISISANLPGSLDSARSSARHQDGPQRSRSNSSSGLGSFSMDTRSPQSSPTSNSSSSEDLPCPKGANSPNIVSESRDDYKSCNETSSFKKSRSPDDCGNSDSGHSGSSRSHDEEFKRPSDSYGRLNINTKQNGASNREASTLTSKSISNNNNESQRGRGIQYYNPSKVSDGVIWNGRVEVPLKVNSNKRDGNTYLATKQIIY